MLGKTSGAERNIRAQRQVQEEPGAPRGSMNRRQKRKKGEGREKKRERWASAELKRRVETENEGSPASDVSHDGRKLRGQKI